MKITLNTLQIADQLKSDSNARWSYNGARALAEYLDTDENADAEFDYVEIRCEYSEYCGVQAWAIEYFGGLSQAIEEFGEDAREFSDGNCDDDIRSYIQDHGTLLEFDGGIIVSQF